MNIYEILAIATVSVHLLWIVWVIFGCLVTRNRPLLSWLHIFSLIYGVVIELAPWPCPLTLTEFYFQRKAGLQPYEESFILHYLEAIVYPDVPTDLLVFVAVGVCLFNLSIYGFRYRRKRRHG